MTQCCHLLHESANELVASHSFVVGCFACFVVCLVFCVVFGFCLFVCFAFLVVDDDGLLDLYRSFTSSLLRPSKQMASRLLSSLVPVRSLTFSARFAACVCFGVWFVALCFGLLL